MYVRHWKAASKKGKLYGGEAKGNLSGIVLIGGCWLEEARGKLRRSETSYLVYLWNILAFLWSVLCWKKGAKSGEADHH